jgi:UDP-glucose 4-epimerase
VIIDNLSNSKIEKLDAIKQFNNSNNTILFYQIDLVNFNELTNVVNDVIIKNNLSIDVIIHLAGLKSVSESIDIPIKYYETNLVTTINLTKIMELFGIKNLLFSSSATVYGSAPIPYSEYDQTGIGITNPYGRSKYIQEEMLKDIQFAHRDWNIILLRYFNPIGHLNMNFKEDPSGSKNHIKLY